MTGSMGYGHTDALLRALAAEQPAILSNLVQFQSQGGAPGRPAPRGPTSWSRAQRPKSSLASS